MHRDGTLTGPNLELLRDVCAAHRRRRWSPAAGCPRWTTCARIAALAGIGVEGAIVGKALYAGAFTLPEALRARSAGIEPVSVAVRVIPCLDVDAGRVVKGVNFAGLRDAGDPVELARRYDEQGADELTFLDITASSAGRETTYDVVRRTAEQVFIPLTVGGGVRTVGRRRRAAARRRRQGRREHRRDRAAGADRPRSPSGSAARCWCCRSTPAGRAAARRPASGFEVTTHGGRPRHRASTRWRGLRAGGRARGGRDPAQLDGRRRHQGRLRPRADRAGAGRGRRCR